MYVTLKLDDNGCCKIHSISDDGNGWIVTDERYVVMPWKMVTRNGKNMTLTEAVNSILNKKNPRLKRAKEERERKRELKRSIKNIMKHILRKKQRD